MSNIMPVMSVKQQLLTSRCHWAGASLSIQPQNEWKVDMPRGEVQAISPLQ